MIGGAGFCPSTVWNQQRGSGEKTHVFLMVGLDIPTAGLFLQVGWDLMIPLGIFGCKLDGFNRDWTIQEVGHPLLGDHRFTYD